MSDETNALLALKNAWSGVVAASDEVRKLDPVVQGLGEATPIADVDLATYHRLTEAQANAVMALRGLIEQLQRKYAVEKEQ